jgi:hypothetical protein
VDCHGSTSRLRRYNRPKGTHRNFCAQQAACSLQPVTIINTTIHDACYLLPTARYDIHWYGPCASSQLETWQPQIQHFRRARCREKVLTMRYLGFWWLAYLFLAVLQAPSPAAPPSEGYWDGSPMPAQIRRKETRCCMLTSTVAQTSP